MPEFPAHVGDDAPKRKREQGSREELMDRSRQEPKKNNYPLRKSRRILANAYKLFKKKGHKLSSQQHAQFKADLQLLDQLLLDRKKKEASLVSQRVENFVKKYFPKNFFDYTKELAFAILFALVVAFTIRQLWFELYQVPTGSMRPTVEELDRMVVSKTTFGLHIPFVEKQLFYHPDFIQRAGCIVFTVKDMDVPDPDMLYFHIFPGKKRYIKRCMTKPGDTIFFYGGRIYAVDREGNPVYELADEIFLKENGIEKIDHIPYITFDGKVKLNRPVGPQVFSEAIFQQMNTAVGRLQLKSNGEMEGRFFNGEQWVVDRPEALKTSHDKPVSYSDLWGIGNYAMARLLTAEEVELFYEILPTKGDALLFLELRHTPNLSFPPPAIRRGELGALQPMVSSFATLIPLNRSHLDAIQKALFTSRFIVEGGRAYRYQEGGGRPQRREFDPKFPGVPNGCYEFYYGIGYRVYFGGIQAKLPPDHPLYSAHVDTIRKLFNLGISFNTLYNPLEPLQPYNPQRFAYFREGDLYLMGAPIFKKDDPILIEFVNNELEKQKSSSISQPYIAFIDHGPPMKEGKLDIEFIKNFGFKVVDNGVIALGDNYSMSADSRDFGVVPTDNLRGAPSFTFWPPGSRLGPLAQPPYPWITLPNLLVWSAAFIILIVCSWYIRKRHRTSYFKENKK